MKRNRGRGRRTSGNAYSNPNRHYESVGPGVKIRGSAQQVLDKYLQYARDAFTNGDRVQAEALFQYAEHYQRIVTLQNAAREKARKDREDKTNEREAQKQKTQATLDDDDATNNATDTPVEVVSDSQNTEKTLDNSGDEADAESKVETKAEAPVKRTRRRKPKVVKPAEDTEATTEPEQEATEPTLNEIAETRSDTRA